MANAKLQVKGDGGSELSIGRMDSKLEKKFNLVEEHLAVVRRELSIRNMHYRFLAKNLILRNWPFYTCVIIFQVLCDCYVIAM